MFTGMGLAKQFINNRLVKQRAGATWAGAAMGAAYGGMSADRGEGWSGAAMGAGFGAGLGRYGGGALRGAQAGYLRAKRAGAPGGATGISAFLGAGRSAINQIRTDGRSLISEARRSMEYIGNPKIKSNKGNAMAPMLNHPQQSPLVGVRRGGQSFSQDDRGVNMVNQALMDRARTTRGYQNPGVGMVGSLGRTGYGGRGKASVKRNKKGISFNTWSNR
jgi:hypothetical protein